MSERMEELAQALWATIGMTIAYACGMVGLVLAWLYYRRRKGEPVSKRKIERGE